MIGTIPRKVAFRSVKVVNGANHKKTVTHSFVVYIVEKYKSKLKTLIVNLAVHDFASDDELVP